MWIGSGTKLLWLLCCQHHPYFILGANFHNAHQILNGSSIGNMHHNGRICHARTLFDEGRLKFTEADLLFIDKVAFVLRYNERDRRPVNTLVGARFWQRHFDNGRIGYSGYNQKEQQQKEHDIVERGCRHFMSKLFPVSDLHDSGVRMERINSKTSFCILRVKMFTRCCRM